MILPTKHIKLQNCILNLGSILLNNIRENQTITLLWEEVKNFPEVKDFERFTLGLDLLFVLSLIEFKDGFIRRMEDDTLN